MSQIPKLLPVMAFLSLSTMLFGEPLELGDPAPEVRAEDHRGEPVDLGEQLAEGTTLVFFYPKAHTGGCTKQACSLRDAWDELNERDVTIFGVSSDPVETQKSFREKYELPFTLLADTEQAVSKAFRKSRWSRHAYIFRDGELVWRDLNASTSKQAEDVLAALDSLPGSS